MRRIDFVMLLVLTGCGGSRQSVHSAPAVPVAGESAPLATLDLPDPDLCVAGEVAVFSCRIAESRRRVSLCLAEGESVRYRFGTKAEVELEFPSEAAQSAAQFRYAHYFRHQTDRTEVSFSNGGFEYAIFDYYEEGESPEVTRGIRISTQTEGPSEEKLLECSGDMTSELQKLEQVLPCDRDSALANCD